MSSFHKIAAVNVAMTEKKYRESEAIMFTYVAVIIGRCKHTLKVCVVIRAYFSILGRIFEWKVKGHLLEKKDTFL